MSQSVLILAIPVKINYAYQFYRINIPLWNKPMIFFIILSNENLRLQEKSLRN